MKYLFLFIFLIGVQKMYAQKYILLDKEMAKPAQYSNSVTLNNEHNGFFPVEKKNMNQFIKALQEIAKKLSTPGPLGHAKQYEIGCISFRGLTVSQANEDRFDYVLTSTCDGVNISVHLCDSKSSNAANAFYITTWIKYIKSYYK
ncbi:MAG: hypothetical protein Q8891_08505 [Bacteroidota bacterium]|nr:hypothetical protein [Bacteroidota bacterium]